MILLYKIIILPTRIQLQPQICLLRDIVKTQRVTTTAKAIPLNCRTEDVKDEAFFDWLMLSAVMGLMMMYNLGVKCMWELVVECAMSWSQCSLLSTGHSAREFLWAE